MSASRRIAAALALGLVGCQDTLWLGAPHGTDPPPACLRAAPAALDLGPVRAGEQQRATVRLRNGCDAPVAVTAVLLGGDPGFAVEAAGAVIPARPAGATERVALPAPLIVPAAGEASVAATYAPPGPSPARASALWLYEAPAGEAGLALAIRANDALPCVVTVPKEVDLGGTLAGVTREVTVRVASCGRVPLRVAGWTWEAGASPAFSAFSASATDAPPLELAPGEELALAVRFAPEGPGPLDSDGFRVPERTALELATDAFDPVRRLAVRAVAVAEPCPDARVDPDTPASVAPGTTLTLDGQASTGHDAPIVRWAWRQVASPAGDAVFEPSADVPAPTVTLEAIGTWRFELLVWDALDRAACAPAEVAVEVVPPASGLAFELTWTTAADPDPTDSGPDAGTDLDLHVLHGDAVGLDLDGDGEPDGWFDAPFDACWSNPAPDWPPFGAAGGDDPSLDRDDTDGAGPERVLVPALHAAAAYRVGVHHWDDHGWGPATARVRAWRDGQPLATPPQRLLWPGELWQVGRLDGAAGALVVEDGVQAILEPLPSAIGMKP